MPFSKGESEPKTRQKEDIGPDSSKNGAIEELRLTWLLKLLVGITLVDMIATGLVVPTIPYYAKSLGMNPSTQGSLMSLYGMLQLVGSPILGKMSDTWGRKPVLLASILGTFVSYSLLIFTSESIAIFVVSRIVVGLLKNTETSCYSVITDISTPSQRVKRMAYIGGAIGLGFIVGPALSGILTSSYNLDTPAYISSIMLFGNTIVVLLLLPETMHKFSSRKSPLESSENAKVKGQEGDSFNVPSELNSMTDDMADDLAAPLDLMRSSGELEKAASTSLPQDETKLNGNNSSTRSFSALNVSGDSGVEDKLSLWKLLLRPNPLRTLVWVYFGTSLAIVIFQGSSVLLFQLIGISVHASSYIISFSGLLTVISSFVIQELSSRYSEKQLLVRSILVVATTLFATVFILMSGSSTLAGLLIAYVPLILGARTIKNCLLGLVTHQTPPSQTGTIIGLLNSLESLCRAIAPLIGGVLMQFFIGAPALAGSIICFAFFAYLSYGSLPNSGFSTPDSKLI